MYPSPQRNDSSLPVNIYRIIWLELISNFHSVEENSNSGRTWDCRCSSNFNFQRTCSGVRLWLKSKNGSERTLTVSHRRRIERGAELSFSGRGPFSTNQIFHQNVLVSPKFFGFRQDRQTDRRTDRQTDRQTQ